MGKGPKRASGYPFLGGSFIIGSTVAVICSPSLSFTVCLGLVTVILLMTFMGFVMRNFNLKLKEKGMPRDPA